MTEGSSTRNEVLFYSPLYEKVPCALQSHCCNVQPALQEAVNGPLLLSDLPDERSQPKAEVRAEASGAAGRKLMR